MLEDKFASLLNTYEQNENGTSIIELLKKDWCLFSHPQMTIAQGQMLLGDVLDDGQLVRQNFMASEQYLSNRLGKWEELRKELMHKNRFFPETEVDLERLEELLSHISVGSIDLQTEWYRARTKVRDELFLQEEMSAPPSHLASHGRANPAGIPYLYLGSEVETAISEIRPHTGDQVCVATFSIPNNLTLVDLRAPRRSVSPFILEDEKDIGKMRSDLVFLERLGHELTRPVRQMAAAFDYTPSQYLCEFIKKSRYDGVLYSSSVSSGYNLALFEKAKARIGQMSHRKVNKVTVEISAEEN
ncbi:RES family NAD+ phosphorylase [Alteromonas sp. B31-7]|uniref:RES family NAD+ phosphorylase n=1 Tax=Alteromonas sp. B31-7 TaxID=2785913 RepID=UPI0018CA1097|nr:RES family NAD+ phosphorylase [Alteromonas sp. B31-7]|tara:strand:+ start:2392 stop:3294 length:903 start_codon:yes stop_codon:yes gene_type:complete